MSAPSDLGPLAGIVTWERFRAAFAKSVPLALLVALAPVFLHAVAERKEIERIAIPLYRVDLAPLPPHAQWDDRDWGSHLGSRWVEVCEHVAAHLAGLP